MPAFVIRQVNDDLLDRQTAVVVVANVRPWQVRHRAARQRCTPFGFAAFSCIKGRFVDFVRQHVGVDYPPGWWQPAFMQADVGFELVAVDGASCGRDAGTNCQKRALAAVLSLVRAEVFRSAKAGARRWPSVRRQAPVAAARRSATGSRGCEHAGSAALIAASAGVAITLAANTIIDSLPHHAERW
ncbi:MAG: hypothetical protein HGA21_16745 [Burkholderiaceae bacterium]|nr:hypothetical protein [Burkholderiaceae bacterium]